MYEVEFSDPPTITINNEIYASYKSQRGHLLSRCPLAQCKRTMLVVGPTRVFPSHQKPTFPNSNSTRNQVDEETICACATYKSLLNYLL